MLTKQEREKIRESILETAKYGESYRNPVAVPGGMKRLSPQQMWQLLNTVDNAEQEIKQLRALIRKLYKIVNLVSLTKCGHQCFTTETRDNLFALLAEAHAVSAQVQEADPKQRPTLKKTFHN